MPASALCRGHRSPSAMRCLRQRNARPRAPTQCPGDSTTRCSHQPTLASSCPPERVSYGRSRGAGNGRAENSPRFRSARSPAQTHPTELLRGQIPPVPRTRGHHTRCPPRSAVLVPVVALQSFSQSLRDKKGVGGLLQAPDLAVSDCPEMSESGLHPPPFLRNAEIVSENDHMIARLEVLVPFRVKLVEVCQEREETTERRVETAIDAPVGESFGNIPLDVIRQERFESIHVSHGVVQLPDESDLRRIRHANLP